MLRAAAAAATAVVFAAAAEEKGYPASYWEVEERKAAGHARQLWPEVYKTTPIFPEFIPVADADGSTAWANQLNFAAAAALSGNGQYFAIGQRKGSKAYPAPPGPSAAVPLATTPVAQGIAHFGKREGTKAVVTQKDITASGLVANAGFGYRVAVSHDGDTMVTSAPGVSTPTGSVFVYRGCRSDSGCELASTIIPAASITGFGAAVAISPDASFIAVSNLAATTVFVYPLKADRMAVASEVIAVDPPASFTIGSGLFGTALKITSKGRRLIVGVVGSSPNNAILVFRREGKFFYHTDTILSTITGANTGFGTFNSVAVAEDTDDLADEDVVGTRFTLVAGQPDSGLTATGKAYVYRCLKGTQNTCSLKVAIDPTLTSTLGETGSLATSVAVSQRGETIAVAGIRVEGTAPTQTGFATVHIYKRAATAWAYAQAYETFAWGVGSASAATLPTVTGIVPLSLSHDGKVLLAGSGLENGAATLISLADEE